MVEELCRDENVGDSEGWAQLRAYRRLQYNRMRRRLPELQKYSALRSGARGSQARKELLAFEKQIDEAKNRYRREMTIAN